MNLVRNIDIKNFSFTVVTVDRLRNFITEVMSRMHAECFIYGNVNLEKATQLSNLVENQLKKTNAFVLPQLSRQLLLKREYKLSESKRLINTYEPQFKLPYNFR